MVASLMIFTGHTSADLKSNRPKRFRGYAVPGPVYPGGPGLGTQSTPVPSDLINFKKHRFGFQLRARWKLSQSNPARWQGFYAASSDVNYQYIAAVGSRGHYPALLPIVKVSWLRLGRLLFRTLKSRFTECSLEVLRVPSVNRKPTIQPT